MLREAGVEVVVGVMEQECRDLNRRFIQAHTSSRPWVQLKWAQTADGFIALPPESGENPLRMSSPVTMHLMHQQRALCDAIVVGAATARIDNPSLTTRYWPGKSPLRVVLSRHLSLPSDINLLNDGLPTIVYNGEKDEEQGSVKYVKMDTSDPMAWLEDLRHRGVTSVMVEGGTNVLQQLIDAGIWDEARVEVSPRTVGKGTPAPIIKGQVTSHHTIGNNEITTLCPMQKQ